MAFHFLDIEQVLRIHQSVVEHYGGSQGVRDFGLLQSALAMPQASYGGAALHEDVYAMAAAYLYHLVQNHAFVDGNNRVGAAAAIIFLAMNSITVDVDEDGLVELTLAVARGDSGKQIVAEFFRGSGNSA